MQHTVLLTSEQIFHDAAVDFFSKLIIFTKLQLRNIFQLIQSDCRVFFCINKNQFQNMHVVYWAGPLHSFGQVLMV